MSFMEYGVFFLLFSAMNFFNIFQFFTLYHWMGVSKPINTKILTIFCFMMLWNNLYSTPLQPCMQSDYCAKTHMIYCMCNPSHIQCNLLARQASLSPSQRMKCLVNIANQTSPGLTALRNWAENTFSPIVNHTTINNKNAPLLLTDFRTDDHIELELVGRHNESVIIDFTLLTAFSSKLIILNLNRLHLRSLPVFPPLKNLQTLRIINSADLAPLPLVDNQFTECSALEHLDFSDNSIVQLPANVFNGLSKLRTLNLESNHLIQLPSLSFLDRLEHLSLSHNSLNKLTSDDLQALHSLLVLDLSHNILVHLSENVFEGLKMLSELNLAHNALSRLPKNLFSNLQSLRILDLSHNRFYTLDADLSSNLALEMVRLNYNLLTTLSQIKFESFFDMSAQNDSRAIYLKKNEFICDCKLFWLRKYSTTSAIYSRIKDLSCKMGQEHLNMTDIFFVGPFIWNIQTAHTCEKDLLKKDSTEENNDSTMISFEDFKAIKQVASGKPKLVFHFFFKNYLFLCIFLLIIWIKH